jgi:hypothetical protein
VPCRLLRLLPTLLLPRPLTRAPSCNPAPKVTGLVTFDNPRPTDAVVAGGRIAICNGVVSGGGANETAASPASAAPGGAGANGVVEILPGGAAAGPVRGCSGSSFSILLGIKPEFGALIPARARAAVPFEGAITIKRATGTRLNSEGVSGPVVSASVDAVLVDGTRVVSPERQIAMEVDAGGWRRARARGWAGRSAGRLPGWAGRGAARLSWARALRGPDPGAGQAPGGGASLLACAESSSCQKLILRSPCHPNAPSHPAAADATNDYGYTATA